MTDNRWPIGIAIYGAGEAINGSGALSPYISAQITALRRVATNQYVAATAQLDSSNVPTLRLVLDPQGRQPVQTLSNVNVGDPAELVNFAAWSFSVCPARASILVLSGHGAAWQDSAVEEVLGLQTRGILTEMPPGFTPPIHHPRGLFGQDVSSAREMTRAVLIDGQYRDYLSNTELGAACARIQQLLGRQIDVLVFDACLMSSVEVLHELGGSVKAVVASVDELSAAGVNIAAACAAYTARLGELSSNEAASLIVQTFSPSADFDSCMAVDISSAAWKSAIGSFARFCRALSDQLSNGSVARALVRDRLAEATTSLVRYNSGGLADVASLCACLSSLAGLSSAASSDLLQFLSDLSGCVVARSVGKSYFGAMGLSIFAPMTASEYQKNQADYAQLDFSIATGWGDILEVLYRE